MARKLPKVLSEAEQERFLAAFFSQTSPGKLPRYRSPRRDYVLARLILGTGLRVSEALALRREHVDLEDCQLIVREGKGSKDRVLWYDDDVAELLERWLAKNNPENAPRQHVFTTSSGRPVNRRDAYTAIRRRARKAQIAEWEKVGVHTLRHTFATNLLRRTHDIFLVKEALGHADVATTMIYLHLVKDDLKNALRRTV